MSAGLFGAPQQERRLQHAGDDRADRSPQRRLERRMRRDDADQRDGIEEDRHAGRQDKAVAGIENARQVGDDGHARQIGHGDLGENHRPLHLFRIDGKARLKHIHQPRHGQFANESKGNRQEDQRGHGVVRHFVGSFLAVPLQRCRIGRHESGRKSAFGKDAAEQVGEVLCRRIGVGHDVARRAEISADDQVAGKTGETRDQREGRVDQRIAQKAGRLARGRRARGRIGGAGGLGSCRHGRNLKGRSPLSAQYFGAWQAGRCGHRRCKTFAFY